MSTPKRIFEFKHPISKRTISKVTISLPYFTLKADHSGMFYDEENQILKETFRYPEAHEIIRVQALCHSLQRHSYDVTRCSSFKTAHHYCEFSGVETYILLKKTFPYL